MLLVVSNDAFYQQELLPELDAAGFTVVEALSLVELRPKLHAATYNLVIVDEALAAAEPTMMNEIDKASGARIAILRETAGDAGDRPVLGRASGAKRVAEEVQKLATG